MIEEAVVNGMKVKFVYNVDKIDGIYYTSCYLEDGRIIVLSKFDGDILLPVHEYEDEQLVNDLIALVNSVKGE